MESNKNGKKDKKFLSNKHKRFKHKKENKKNKKKEAQINKNKVKQLSPVEELYQKAKLLYESSSKNFDLDKIDLTLKANKDKKWTSDILKTGTFEDKISSLVLYIRQNPKNTLKYLDILVRMAEDKNRRRNESVITALKDLFLENLLQNKKYIPFISVYPSLKENHTDDDLIKAYYDDKLHNLYSKVITMLENCVINEPMAKIKKKKMDLLYEMIAKQPEGEEKILTILINKLGDPMTEISNHAILLLKNLQKENMKMSLVLFNNVKTFYLQSTRQNSKLYSLVYMTQMAIPYNFPSFLEESIKFFFELFNKFSESSTQEGKDSKEAENIEKSLSLIVKRINALFKYVKGENTQIEKIKTIINEKLSVLFKLSHNKSLKLSIEILKLLFGIISTQDESFSDRYYKSLYDLVSNFSLSISKHLKDGLKLIMLSIAYDTKIPRICSFIKRLLEMSLHSEPPYIICILIMISQIIRTKKKLWKCIEKPQQYPSFYDQSKRDPQFAGGEISFFNELYILTNHYHPSVKRMSKFIIDNFNKDIISYEGDPLVDFSLVNFLEKFILKNPKIKKEKTKILQKGKGVNEEEEELKKFMEEDDENAKKEGEENEEIGDDDLQFIKKFNTVFPKITNSKNYLKKIKKKEMKNDEDEVLNEEEGTNDRNIDKFADKIIEKEYEKYDQDVDDDDIEGLDDDEEENEEDEEEMEDFDNEGDFFDGESDLDEDENEKKTKTKNK